MNSEANFFLSQVDPKDPPEKFNNEAYLEVKYCFNLLKPIDITSTKTVNFEYFLLLILLYLLIWT